MALKTFAGTTFLPTIARLILCAAFLPQGWLKCFTTTEFSGEQANRLQQLGVAVTPVAPGAGNAPAFNLSSTTLAAQDQAGGDDDAEESADENAQPQESTAQDTPADTRPTTPAEPRTVEARTVYKVALLVDAAGWPYPVVAAWLAGLTELIGGALLLVGLLSRVWGLGLCIAMGVAFYLVTLDGAGNPPLGNNLLSMSRLPFEFATNTSAYNTMFSQLGLFFCALLILMVGPGPLSLDRIILGRRSASRHGDDIYTE